MKRFIGPSVLALSIVCGSTLAMAQSAAPEASNPPAASTEMKSTEPSAPATAPAAEPAATPTETTPLSNPADTAAVAPLEKTYAYSEAKDWEGKRLYSVEGNDIGEISAVEKGADGNVKAFHADIGGFLGIGETKVVVEPSQLSLINDKLTISMTEKEAKDLPKVSQ